MITTRALACTTLLLLCAAITVALALANGSTWPGALLAALTTSCSTAGILLAVRSSRPHDDEQDSLRT